MKRKIYHFIFVVVCVLSLCGCNNTSKIKGNTRKVVIPYSFSLLCGQTSEKDLNKMVKTYNKDKNYCSKAYAATEGLADRRAFGRSRATDSQIEKYIKDNKKIIDTAMKKFIKSNKLYKYKIKEDYSSIQLYFDENILEDTYQQLLAVSINFTSLNSILLNGKDWHIKWQVINCHTNKTVVTWNLPNDEENSFTSDDLKQSYE